MTTKHRVTLALILAAALTRLSTLPAQDLGPGHHRIHARLMALLGERGDEMALTPRGPEQG